MQGHASAGRIGHRFLKRRERAAGGKRRGGPEMDEDRGVPIRRHGEQMPQLFVAGARRIADTKPEAQPALVETIGHQATHLTELVLRSRIIQVRVCLRGAPEREGILTVALRDQYAERFPAGPLMADRRSEIDQGPPFPSGVPLVNRVDTDFQLERRGHAVARLIATALWVLPVCMEVDETRRDHQA